MDFYFAVVTPGLEEIAAQEIQEVLAELSETVTAQHTAHVEANFLSGQIFFGCDQAINPRDLVARVHTVERMCALVGVLTDVPSTSEEAFEAFVHWPYHWGGGRFQRACQLWQLNRSLIHTQADKDVTTPFTFLPRNPSCSCESCVMDETDAITFRTLQPFVSRWVGKKKEEESSLMAVEEQSNAVDHVGSQNPAPVPPIPRSFREVVGENALFVPPEEVDEGEKEGRVAPSFRVTAQRGGNKKTHAFNSVNIAQQLGGGIYVRYEWPASMKNYDVHVWAQLIGSTLLVGLSLLPEPPILHRRSRKMFGKTSLAPSVAASICRFARIRSEEVVLDPMCGSGTIPIEASLLAPGCVGLGGELDDVAVNQSYVNSQQALQIESLQERFLGVFPPQRVFELRKKVIRTNIIRWDVTRIPIRDHSVDVVICDMPFGRRSGSYNQNAKLYPKFMKEIVRVLRPGGRMILLTLQKKLMNRMLEMPVCQVLRLKETYPCYMGGLELSLYYFDYILPQPQ